MKVTYITLDPLRYPRVKKLAYSLRKYGNIEFHVMLPKVRLISHGSRIRRMVYAVVNYSAVMLQIFFVRSKIFWVANCPDILAVPLIFRRKWYILEYRSPWPSEVESEFGSKPLVCLATAIERVALKYASLVTLTTSMLRAKVKDFSKPVFVIPNYPLKSFGTAVALREEFRRGFGCRENDRVVLFVGKLTHVEGADLLPKIIEDVLKKADVIFWVVGDGSLYALLEKTAKKFPKNVKLFGWQMHERIPDFISAADVCIAPRHRSPFSVFYNEEGLQKFSEYMFFEKPIVACGVAESPEYLLVDEDDMAGGILKALNGLVSPSRRKIWEDYSEKAICEMFTSIYDDMP